MVFDVHEPTGDRRRDYHMAQVMALWAELYRDREQRAESYAADDFMPDFWWHGPARDRRTPEEWDVLIQTLNMMYGGVDLRHGNGR